MNDEELKKVKAEQEARWLRRKTELQAAENRRIEPVSNPVELPRFMWVDIDAQASDLGVSRDALLRVWLIEKLK